MANQQVEDAIKANDTEYLRGFSRALFELREIFREEVEPKLKEIQAWADDLEVQRSTLEQLIEEKES